VNAAASYLTDEEVTARLQRAEASSSLLEFSVDGWMAWPILRFAIGSQLRQRPEDAISLPAQDSSRLRTLADIVRLARLPRAENLALSHYSSHVEPVGRGEYKDIYFDDLLGGLDAVKYVFVDNPTFEDRKSFLPAHLTSRAVEALGDRWQRWFPPARLRAVARDIGRIASAELGLPLSEDIIFRRLASFSVYRRLYEKILGRVRPARLLLVTGYSNHALQAAAKEFGAAVVELQHGFLDRYHIGYSWGSAARDLKPRMPIPQRILLYGDHWKRHLLADGFWSDEDLVVVGSARMDDYRRRRRETSDERLIVVTAQTVDTPRLIQFLSQFLRVMKHAGKKTKLVVKLHPSTTTKCEYDCAVFRESGASVFLSVEEPSTFELLSRAYCHVSIFSSCHFEAIGLGVPTVVLPLSGSERMAPLVQAGHATAVSSPEELASVICLGTLAVPSEAVRHDYFEVGAVPNSLAYLHGHEPQRSRATGQYEPLHEAQS
jgi:hypothetical protein